MEIKAVEYFNQYISGEFVANSVEGCINYVEAQLANDEELKEHWKALMAEAWANGHASGRFNDHKCSVYVNPFTLWTAKGPE